MPLNRLNTIVRNNKFYDEGDFALETRIAENYILEDLHQSVVLYEVDRKRTNVNDIYKESPGIRFKAPREIPCMFEVAKPDTKSYDEKSNNGVYSQSGNLTMYVLVRTLEEMKCDIKRGDYIGVPIDVDRMYYFVVTNDGKMNTANANYIGAYKTAWREITAAPTTKEEFNAR
ncbi:MAG: hypothetical protein LUD72_04545 [Bacteroidales bacterium]|nr:hypothetical protein [Bacteroidales bacterium]